MTTHVEKALSFLAEQPFTLDGVNTWSAEQTIEVYQQVHKWICGGGKIQTVKTTPVRPDGKISFEMVVHYYPQNWAVRKVHTESMLIRADARRSNKHHTERTEEL